MLRTSSWLLLFFCFSVSAASVWQVSKGDSKLYIGGTMHLLASTDYPLPPAYAKAFAKSDKVIFETDLDTINSAAFAIRTMALMTYPEGKDLSFALSPATMQRLEKHLQSRKVPINTVMKFKPSLLSLTLSNIEFQALGMTQPGVDQFYFDKAKEAHKEIDWLESTETQLSFLAGLGKDDEDALIQYTLDEITHMQPMLEMMKNQWREGDMEAMNSASVLPLAQNYPQIYQDLLVTRNHAWMEKIVPMFHSSNVEFILVGTLHLAGKDSVLNRLAELGYKVEMVK